MAKSSKNDQSIESKECFIIMPISDQEGYEPGHFSKVYNDIIEPACEKAGYKAIRADQIKETNLIHLDILQKILESPIAICDLSSRNPNVLFELGLRQAFDKPVVLIQEQGTPQIFDITPLRYTTYRSELKYREVLEDQLKIKEALEATIRATSSEHGQGINSLVKLLAISSPARLPENANSDSDLEFQVLKAELSQIRSQLRDISNSLPTGNKSIPIPNLQSPRSIALDSEINKITNMISVLEENVLLGIGTREDNIREFNQINNQLSAIIGITRDPIQVSKTQGIISRMKKIQSSFTIPSDNDLPF